MSILVAQAHDWIHTACRRFTEATGWPLVFTPTTPGEAAGLERRLRSENGRPWFEAIRDEDETIGFLHIEAPDGTGSEPSFLAVTEMAEVVGDLMGRLASACTALDSRSREVSTLVEIGRSIPVELDTAGALRQLLRAIVELTDFRAAAFFLLDARTQSLRLRLLEHLDGLRIPAPERHLADSPPDLEALVRGEMLVNARETPEAALWLPDSASMGWCAAVQSEAGPVGTLWAFDRRDRKPSRRERHVLQSIAAQFSGVLERAVLREESATQHRLRRELESVGRFNGGNLVRTIADDGPFDVAAVCTSRYEVGGDMCEVIPIDEHRTVVAIGDASGDSTPAALVMSAVRGALRTLLDDRVARLLETDRAVQRLNRMLHDVTPPHQFMSFFFGVLDSRAMTLTYTNAGHPSPILLRRNEVTELVSHGLLLGVLDDAAYDRSTIGLHEGDLFAFFSDGITEAMCRRKRMFRATGIADAMRDRLHLPVREVLAGIWSELETHTEGAKGDDRTLLVLRVRGEAGSEAAFQDEDVQPALAVAHAH